MTDCVNGDENCKYKVGDTKTIEMGTLGTHTLRIANMSTPDECKQEGFSQSVCGFVIELADIITKHTMNDTNTNKGGWPASGLYTYLNNDIYNALPEDLKGVIKDTVTVSGHGKDDTDNFTSTDKLYLLAPKEIYSNWSPNYDSAKDLTRQLDYYNEKGVTTSSKDGAIKKNSTGTAAWWWLRCASSYSSNSFFFVNGIGEFASNNPNSTIGVSPAFRIG